MGVGKLGTGKTIRVAGKTQQVCWRGKYAAVHSLKVKTEQVDTQTYIDCMAACKPSSC